MVNSSFKKRFGWKSDAAGLLAGGGEGRRSDEEAMKGEFEEKSAGCAEDGFLLIQLFAFPVVTSR